VFDIVVNILDALADLRRAARVRRVSLYKRTNFDEGVFLFLVQVHLVFLLSLALLPLHHPLLN